METETVVAVEISIARKFSEMEEKILAIELHVAQIKKEHEFFLQSLEDAATEIASNTMTRVMLPEKMRQTLDNYLAIRKQQREKSVNEKAIDISSAQKQLEEEN